MASSYTIATAPRAVPLVGHVPLIVRDPLDYLRRLPLYGDVVKVRLGTIPVYVVCHPHLVQQVLRDDRTFVKGGPMYDAFSGAFGDGLFTSAIAKWSGPGWEREAGQDR